MPQLVTQQVAPQEQTQQNRLQQNTEHMQNVPIQQNAIQQGAMQQNAAVRSTKAISDQTGFIRTGTWEVMSADEIEIEDLDARTRYMAPVPTREQKRSMKNLLKANSKVRRELQNTSIVQLAVWGQASKTIDGASTEFEKLSDTLYSFATSYGKYESADEKSKTDAEFEKNDEAVNMIKAAQAYIALHDNESQFTDKGKNRMALARYIVSKDFITKYLVPASYTNGANEQQYLNNVYDADSFVFEHKYRKALRISNKFVSQPEVFNFLGDFAKKYCKNDDARKQIAVLFSADEKQNERTLAAMMKAMEDPADMTELYLILDEKTNAMLKVKVTPEMFSKEYIMKHPGLLVHLDYLSRLSADFYGKDGIYGKIGHAYMDSLRKNHPEVAKAFEEKSKLLASYGCATTVNVQSYFAVSTTFTYEEVIFNEDTKKARTYSVDPDANDAAEPYTIETFKSEVVDGAVEDKYFTTNYHFGRKKIISRLAEFEKKRISSNQKDYETAKKTNDAIDKNSLKFMDYVTKNDACSLISYYVPKDSLFEEKLKALIDRDISGGAKDLDRLLAGMLKMVRFDALGDPLPEYKNNHQWNINWIKGYTKAISDPTKRCEEYEQCLKDLIEWSTSEENVKRFKAVCESKSYEKNANDMEFYLRMNAVALRLFDNHLTKSKVAAPFLAELGRDKEKNDAVLNYVSKLGAYHIYDIQAKYQVSITTHKFLIGKMLPGEQLEDIKAGYKAIVDAAEEELKKYKTK